MKPAGKRALCRDSDETCWEESFFANLPQDQEDDHEEMSGDELEDEQENPILHGAPLPMVNSYKLVNEFLEVQHFLQNKGHIHDSFTIGSFVDNITSLQLAASRQTTLDS